METEVEDTTWATFLDQHKSLVSLLDDHASLLTGMRKLCKEGTKTHEAVHVRLMTTENLLGRLKDSTERLQFITGREEDVIKDAREAAEPEISAVPVRPFKIPTSQIPTKSAPDPSGLFTLDPNPTPIEQLYKERPTPMVTTPGKWKRTFEDQKSQAEAAAENEPDRKRPKRDGKHSGVAQPRVEKENGVKDGDDEDESFTKAVEARAKAKEEKRLSRKDKKRKREESGESAETPKSPKGKKRKEKHKPEGTESATAAAPAADPVPVAKPDKAKEKQKDKRHLAEADLNDDENIDGGSRKKRKRKHDKAKP